MFKKDKYIKSDVKILIQVVILLIISSSLVISYYKSKKNEYTVHMSDTVQRVSATSKSELYNNFNVLKAIIYDLQTTPDFPNIKMYPMVMEYFARNSQVKKMSLTDVEGNVISILDQSGLEVLENYKDLSGDNLKPHLNHKFSQEDMDITMTPSIFSDYEIDIMQPMYKDRKLIGTFFITIDAKDMFSGFSFHNILEENEIAIMTPLGETIFKSEGFTGENIYSKNVNIEAINWIVQIESKHNSMEPTIKNTILLSLGLLFLVSIVIYLEWLLLHKNEYIVELKRLQNEIKTIAYKDSLTGLHNRLSITEQISTYISNAKTKDKCAVIFLDLDDFKNVNDVFGHEKGDDLLKSVSDVFKKIHLRDSRVITSRIGGDEFIVLFKDIKSKAEIHSFCKEILSGINSVSYVDKKRVNVSASIGVSFFPQNGLDIETLFKNSDLAMYESKYKGKNQYSFFGDKMGEKIKRKTFIESQLRTLIGNDDFSSFSLVYQPQVYLSSSSKYLESEALIRWNDKELGFVPPSEFIKLAETTGTISNLGYWVLRESCRYLNILESTLKVKQNISVNISPEQFKTADFVEKSVGIVNKEGVSPSQITMEITEQVFIDNMKDCIDILNKLKSVGFKISLDDFGTGYSSLSYLSKLPIDTLKVDKSFVDNIESDTHCLALIEGVIKLSHSIDLKVIIEGVETDEQYKLLNERKADAIQGYYFSKPLTAGEYLLYSKEKLIKET